MKQVKRDGLDAALEAEVDALLSTQQFGERWGRHWLDVARFGESSGKEANIAFPYAWRYRDYVIDAVNADMPFNRFITEQVAGDLLPFDNDAERPASDRNRFWRRSQNLEEGNQAQFAADIVDEQIDVVTRAVLGQSVACALSQPRSIRSRWRITTPCGSLAARRLFRHGRVACQPVGGDPLKLPPMRARRSHRPFPKSRSRN